MRYGRGDGSMATTDVQDGSSSYFSVYNVTPLTGRFLDAVRYV
jgi:hypothetical protein